MVLAEELLGGELDDDDGDLGLVEEKRMFGGLGFMVAGHLSVCAGSKGDLMVRVDPAELETLCADDGVQPLDPQMVEQHRLRADHVANG